MIITNYITKYNSIDTIYPWWILNYENEIDCLKFVVFIKILDILVIYKMEKW
jgi:hypothetical protein